MQYLKIIIEKQIDLIQGLVLLIKTNPEIFATVLFFLVVFSRLSYEIKSLNLKKYCFIGIPLWIIFSYLTITKIIPQTLSNEPDMIILNILMLSGFLLVLMEQFIRIISSSKEDKSKIETKQN